MMQAHCSRLMVTTWLFFLSWAPGGFTQDAPTYFPGKFTDWEVRAADDVGLNAERLAEAVEFAVANENPDSRELADVIAVSFANEPYNSIVGPTQPRGGANGLIIRHGYIVAEWGDTSRVDMTFSCTKSYLSTVAGLMIDDGLIHDAHDPVRKYVRDGHYESQHNAKITWHHLLNQTSDWSGELWGKPDWADRPVGDRRSEWRNRELHEPGSHMKYNDVRVNLLAYSLLQVAREPLPQLLRERIMDPIGASPTWRWHGYRNSWVELDGRRVQSVSGGGHWGGGLFICSRDHARLGYLFLRQGEWNGQQLISRAWIAAARVPTDVKPDYGYMWWLNTDRQRIPAAPDSAFFAAGFGGNYVYIDPEHDLVVVLRWTQNMPQVIERILSAFDAAA
jgi:CubicO group peptidase (beta-lactamase class C family)